MNSNPKSISFKFAWVTHHEWTSSKLRETGLVNQQQLVLGKARFSQSQITDITIKDEQLILTIEIPDQEIPEVVAIQIHDKKTDSIKRFVNYGFSRRIVKQTLTELSREQGEIQIREVVCPQCEAAILLEGRSTPQFYCRYCDTLTSENESDEIKTIELVYHLCERCQMYSRPHKFTVFFFYFVFYFGGIHHKVVKCCPGCFRKTAWLMLFGNLPFVLGIPVALAQLQRCYCGAIRKGPFRGLHEANKYLRRGRVQQALEKYEEILERHPLSAGVKYNISLGLLEQGDVNHAIQMLELTIEDCQNYLPAQERLVETLFANGKSQRGFELGTKYRLGPSTIEEMAIVYGAKPDTLQ